MKSKNQSDNIDSKESGNGVFARDSEVEREKP